MLQDTSAAVTTHSISNQSTVTAGINKTTVTVGGAKNTSASTDATIPTAEGSIDTAVPASASNDCGVATSDKANTSGSNDVSGDAEVQPSVVRLSMLARSVPTIRFLSLFKSMISTSPVQTAVLVLEYPSSFNMSSTCSLLANWELQFASEF